MPEFNQTFLMVRLSSIGDIVHTLPAVAALGRAYPRAEIHWAVESRFAPLLQGNPFVHRVIKLDTYGWRRNLASGGALKDISRAMDDLRESSYDAAIDFQGLLKSAILARLSRSRQRVGLARRWLREPAAAAFYTRRVSPEGRKHVIEINLALVEHLGARPGPWEFPLPASEDDKAAVQQQLASLGTTGYIIVNPGGGWKAKRWSPEDYGELVARLVNELAVDVLLTGSESERPIVLEILDRARTPRAKGFPSTLTQFVALARGARLLIGGDTGPLHLAAAVGTPIVALFDSADPLNTPERNGPFNPADIILRGRSGTSRKRSKNRNNLAGIPVESVLSAALKRLADANG